MQIKELVRLIKSGYFKGISSSSRSVKKGFLFIAVKGAKEDGSKFVPGAIASGAKAVVCDLNARVSVPEGVHLIKVRNTRLAAAQLAAEFYRNPSHNINIVGVTGTSGKTTVTYLLEAVIKECGFRPAVIGTVSYRFKGKIIPSKNTTPGPVELNSMIAGMVKEKADYAAIEVSSHALDQRRVFGIRFHSAILTNITYDHLDYHKTVGRYIAAKSKLFRGLRPSATAVLNRDDKYYPLFKRLTRAKIMDYGLGASATIRAEGIKYGVNSTKFLLVSPTRKISLETPLIGRHNVYNILAAFAWGYKEGLPLDKLKSALERFNLVPGRMERVGCKKGFSIFVDYAHTEDALKNALLALRNLPYRRIITLFGCGGERDVSKRPKMGKIATELSDFVVITNDNPRSESPDSIISDIKSGIRKKNFSVIPDRREAIRYSLSIAQEGDLVLIAGKGHENYQVLKGKTISFSDRKEIKLCLKSMN